MRDKRILAIGDLHCGHQAGLTPPRYWASADFKWGISQREAWDWYSKTVKKNGPYDLVICNGDAITGKNDRQGGTQLITADRNQQVSMAMACLDVAKCDMFRLTYGTGYHTGQDEDWELTLTKRLLDNGYNAKIDAHGWYDVNGRIISARHKMGTSSKEELRGTPLLNQKKFNDQWVTRGIQPKADIILRSHVHWNLYTIAQGVHIVAMPCLMTLGDKYGARECDGTVDYGVVIIDISKQGNIHIEPITEVLASQPDYAEVI